MDDSVTIKGTKDGLVISLGDGPLDAVLHELEARLNARASFFLGGRAALRVGGRPLSVAQLQEIGAIVERVGMTLWAVDGDHPETHVAAREVGLETGLCPPPAPAPSQEATAREEMPAMVVRRTLRAGQELAYAGHITLIGDVNPGAEVIAGGDVIVWGKLRGRVHAGALGDEGAVICALQLAPSQIRIASHIAQAPERARPPKAPEMATVQEGRIVVERWDK